MLLRRLTDFIFKNRWNAILLAFISAFIPLIGTVSILIAALVTLRRGAVEGLLVAVAASIPYVIGYFVYPGSDQGELALYAIEVMLISNLLTWLSAVILREYKNWGFTLQLTLILGVLTIAVVHIIYPDVQAWWSSQLTAYFAKTGAVIDKLKNEATPTDIQAQVIAVTAKYATGFLVASILFNALLQLVIARWWQALIFNPGGLQKELHHIRFGHAFGLLFVIAIASAYWGNAAVLDMMPILYLVFFVGGLSVLHAVIAQKSKSKGWLWLMLIYVGVIWLFPLSVVLIAMVGLLDTYFDVRHRWVKKI